MKRGSAINGPPASADVALAVTAGWVLGVTLGVLLAEVVAGVVVGAGTAVVFHFVLRSVIVLRSIITRK
jgi:hypothetical protein